MKIKALLNIMLISVVAPVLAGCVVRERAVYVQPAPAAAVVDDPQPPAPLVEVQPAMPDPTFVWIGGVWEWRGRWVWVGGHWGPRPHPGAVWVRGGWVHRGHGRVWVSAHWR